MSKKNPSRAERFSAAKDVLSGAKEIFEELENELQSWRDNLPENLQSSNKADELDNAISELQGVISLCDDIEGTDVEFPRMF